MKPFGYVRDNSGGAMVFQHQPFDETTRLLCSTEAVYSHAQMQDAAEKEREALRRIDEWAKAYPLDVFPEPDLKRAHEVLEAAGLSLGQISAHAMRHVLTGVQKIAAPAMAG